jgi:hypothetical protein
MGAQVASAPNPGRRAVDVGKGFVGNTLQGVATGLAANTIGATNPLARMGINAIGKYGMNQVAGKFGNMGPAGKGPNIGGGSNGLGGSDQPMLDIAQGTRSAPEPTFDNTQGLTPFGSGGPFGGTT